MAGRVGGIISVQVNGIIILAKGKFTYDVGSPKRKSVMGSDGTNHGYTEEPKPGFIEGAATDDGSLDTTALTTLANATVTLELATGKVIALYNAFYSGDGTGESEEGEFPLRFEGDAEEITS